MKKIKCTYIFLLLISTFSFFAQNKKQHVTPPSTQNLPPVDYFSWLNTCSGDTTCFINQSIRSYSYTWTLLGDTVNSHGTHYAKKLYTAANDSVICYHFNKPGTYTICFIAFDNHIDSISPTLTIDTITKADFDFVHCANNFVNHSLCAHSFYWDFGDGTTSTNPVPHHQYADTGTYNVTLIAYNGAKSDTLTQPIYIAVTAFANTNFTYTVSHDTVWTHAEVNSIPSTTFFWSFGDGGYSSGQDTVYVYKDSTAAYIISLNATNGCGPQFGTSADTVYVTQLPPPQPNFSYINTCLGDTTCFINQSIGGITYTWTVSDTSVAAPSLFSSINSAMCFRFPYVGSYSVTLTTKNNSYTELITKLITIGTTPVADFSFISCSNNFANSSGCATSFYWNFGDGFHSTQILPNHQYADTGYYQVALTAYNTGDSSMLTKLIHVSTTSSADASFTTVISNDTLRAHANYTGIPAPTYYWTFGDGTHATGRDTVHIYYDTTQFYNVKLIVTNLCGVVSKTDTIQTIYYNNKPPSNLDFSHSILTIAPNPVPNNSYVDAFFNSYDDNIYLGQIYNSLGQKMFEEYFAFQFGINEFKISTVNLSSGLYVLTLQAGNSYMRQKFYIINKP